MKRNKVSKLQMRRLAAGVTIALLAGSSPGEAGKTTKPLPGKGEFYSQPPAQECFKNKITIKKNKTPPRRDLNYYTGYRLH